MTPEDAPEVRIEQFIRARPQTVFRFLTETELWLQWQGVRGEIDARAGGIHRIDVRGDGFASGQFLEVRPHDRIAFTWGFEHDGHPLGPGQSIVVIELEAVEGGTLLTLVQRDLPPEMAPNVQHGWANHLRRLAVNRPGFRRGSGLPIQSLHPTAVRFPWMVCSACHLRAITRMADRLHAVHTTPLLRVVEVVAPEVRAV